MPRQPLSIGRTASARSIAELVETRAEIAGAAPAILAGPRPPLDYRGLAAIVRDTGDALARLGVGRGVRVAIVLPDSAEMATASLAIAAVASCVPLNPGYTRAEFERLMKALAVRWLVTGPDRSAARQAASAAGIGILDLVPRAGACVGEFDLVSVAPCTAAAEGAGRARPPGCEDAALVLHTSGSTAEPKIVPLTQRNLLASAANVARSLRLDERDRCLSSLPMFHVGGLVDLLLAPLSVGASIAIAGSPSSAAFFECLDRARPTWYQGVPTMLQDILQRVGAERREVGGSSLRFVRSVSAPLPAAVGERFERCFGVPVIEIYGMTETAGVITSNPLPPGERRRGSVGVAAGPEVAVVDAHGEPVAVGQRGEVVVRGPNVFAGYERASPDVGADFFGEWLRTGDEGFLDGDGYLFLTGRIKEIINRGGEKVSPREIDEIAAGHPGIREAAAFALPHASLGEQVAIAVVPHAGERLDAGGVVDFLAARLAPFKVPRIVFFRDELPRTVGGKLRRRELARVYGDQPVAAAAPRRRPESDLSREIAAIWQSVLGVQQVGIDDDFFDLGGDSLKVMTFLQLLQERTGFTIEAAALLDAPTIAQLERRVVRPPAEPAPLATGVLPPDVLAELQGLLSSWEGRRASAGSLIVGQNTDGTRPPLFWGCNGQVEFASLAQHLGADQPIWGLRSLLAVANRSSTDEATLARHYLPEVLAVQPRGPFRLGGFCAGARVAFELARLLSERGHEVALLCMQDQSIRVPYAGRVALFEHAPWNSGLPADRAVPPAGRGALGERVDPEFLPRCHSARRYCSGGATLHVSPVPHDECYQEHNVAAFARVLGRELVLPAPVARSTRATAAATLAAKLPFALVGGTEREVVVVLTNAGDATIAPSGAVPGGAPAADRAPVAVGACWFPAPTPWLRWLERFRQWVRMGDAVPLTAAIPPRARATIAMRLRVPTRPGLWRLELDVIDVDEHGLPRRASAPLCRRILVLPGRRFWRYVVDRVRRRPTPVP